MIAPELARGYGPAMIVATIGSAASTFVAFDLLLATWLCGKA